MIASGCRLYATHSRSYIQEASFATIAPGQRIPELAGTLSD